MKLSQRTFHSESVELVVVEGLQGELHTGLARLTATPLVGLHPKPTIGSLHTQEGTCQRLATHRFPGKDSNGWGHSALGSFGIIRGF